MLYDKINKQHRPIYRFALIFISLLAFLVIPMYISADDGADVKYVRIKNSWKPMEYLYEQNSKVVYGSLAVNDPAFQWVIEDYNGSKRIMNRATGHYINISGNRKKGEGDYWNDPVKCGEWKDGSNSFLWTTPVQPEGMNITSVLNSAFNIHVEDQNGMAQCSDVPSNWGSPQWIFEAASLAVPEADTNANTNSTATANTNTNTTATTDANANVNTKVNPVVVNPPAQAKYPVSGPKVGGDVAFTYSTPGTGYPLTDTTVVPWLALDTYFNKSLGDHSSIYFKLVTSVCNQGPKNLTAKITLSNYGYTYNVNDWLSFSARVDEIGDVLADTQVLNDGWNWYYSFNNGAVKMDMRFAPFVQRTEIKMDAAVLPGMNLTLAYSPTDGDKPSQYLARFKYAGNGFAISGGYTNTSLGYGRSPDLVPYVPTYALSGSLTAIPNIDLYGEYMDKGYYLVKGNVRLNPFTLKVTYGNVGASRIGLPTYLADTIDSELDFTVSPKLKFIAGLSYAVNTGYDGLAIATGGLTMGPLTLMAQHDFNNNPALSLGTLVPNTTRITGKYSLEGSSALEAEYNLENKVYSIMLHSGF